MNFAENNSEVTNTLNSIVDHPILRTLGFLVAVSSGQNILPTQKLPNLLENLMNNLLVRMVFLFLIVYALSKNLNTSVLIVGALYFLQQNEQFTQYKISQFEKMSNDNNAQEKIKKSKNDESDEEEEESDDEEEFYSNVGPNEYTNNFDSFDRVQSLEKFSNKKKYNPRSSYFKRR